MAERTQLALFRNEAWQRNVIANPARPEQLIDNIPVPLLENSLPQKEILLPQLELEQLRKELLLPRLGLLLPQIELEQLRKELLLPRKELLLPRLELEQLQIELEQLRKELLLLQIEIYLG